MRLIDADKLLSLFEKMAWYNLDDRDDAEDATWQCPAIDAVPVVHGRWVINKKFADYECSVCGQGDVIAPYFERLKMNYCPNCGAKMDGDGNG